MLIYSGLTIKVKGFLMEAEILRMVVHMADQFIHSTTQEAVIKRLLYARYYINDMNKT